MKHQMQNCKILKTTEKGALISFDMFEDAVWIPQEGIHPDSPIYKEGEEGELIVYAWCAEKKGWL